MTVRQLIEALARRQEPGPETPPAPPSMPVPPPPPPAEMPPLRVRYVRLAGGPLGYAVARYDSYGRTVLTHASLMPRSEAEREANAQRQADRVGYSWAVVEVRRPPVSP